MFPGIDDTQRGVARLFPGFARCAVMPVTDGCTTPFPEELDAVATAVPARRREFVCGRASAHAALRELGAGDAPIAMGKTRAPIWPAGVVGSISHTRALAGAVVCRDVDARAVGLDLERADAVLDDEVRRLVLTSAEMVQVDALRPLDTRVAVLIFSAKECLYKVVAPLWGWSLEHQEVEIRIDLRACRFTATLAASISMGTRAADDMPRRVLDGTFTFAGDHVASGICVPRRA